MDRRISTRLRIFVALVYWLLYLGLFVGLKYTDDEGGIPLIILGLPWSIPLEVLLYAASSLSPAVDRILVTEGSNFFATVLVCGTLNATLILGVSRVTGWLRRSRWNFAFSVVAAVGLLVSVQVSSSTIERDALERSRPQNVPREAVHLDGVRGVWQHCAYDPARKIDFCRIWNRKGLILQEGEFIPFDRGAPATQDQLGISSQNGMPQTIALRNGRILIEKAREADMRRFIGSASGHD